MDPEAVQAEGDGQEGKTKGKGEGEKRLYCRTADPIPSWSSRAAAGSEVYFSSILGDKLDSPSCIHWDSHGRSGYTGQDSDFLLGDSAVRLRSVRALEMRRRDLDYSN
jgi:hypothetical protein